MANTYRRENTTSIRGGINPYLLQYNGIGDQVMTTADKLTEDRKESMRQRAIMNEAVSKMKINDADRPWMSQQLDKAQKEINENLFKPDEVMRIASDLMSNKELLARERANTEYEETWKGIQSNQRFDEVTKARWKDQNKYSFNPTQRDDNGNVVAGNVKYDTQHWSGDGALPVEDKTDVQMLQEIVSIAAPTMKSNEGGTSSAITNANGTGSSSQRSWGNSVKELSYDKLVETKNAYFSPGSAGRNAIEQRFRNLEWQRQQLLSQLNDSNINSADRDKIIAELARCNVIYKDNNPEASLLTLDEYINKVMDPLLKEAAYRHTETKNVTGSSRDNQSASGSGGGGGTPVVVNVNNAPDIGNPQTGAANGVPTQQRVNAPWLWWGNSGNVDGSGYSSDNKFVVLKPKQN